MMSISTTQVDLIVLFLSSINNIIHIMNLLLQIGHTCYFLLPGDPERMVAILMKMLIVSM